MKKSIYFAINLGFLLFINCKNKQFDTSIFPSYIPINKSQSVVFDSANLFSSAEKDSLTIKIIQYEEQTSNEIGILSIDSLPKNIEVQYFSTQVANSWGIGKKEKDNGLIITISKFDKKVAISTGLGTEKTISDYDCKAVIDRLIIPSFKVQDYYQGVNKALDSLFILWD